MLSSAFGVLVLVALAACSLGLVRVGLADAGQASFGRSIAAGLLGLAFAALVLVASVLALVRGAAAPLWPASMPLLRAALFLAVALGAAAVVVVGVALPPGRGQAALAPWVQRAGWMPVLALLLLCLTLAVLAGRATGLATTGLRVGALALVLATLAGAALLTHQARDAGTAARAAQERRFPGSSSPRTGLWQRVDGGWAYDGTPFEAADAASLAPLSGEFARDAVQGYYRGTAVPGSDGPSFEVLGRHEARDRQSVYWADTYRLGQEYWLVRRNRVQVIDGADPARYQVLRYGYGRDDRHAYFEGKRLPQVRDGAHFEVLTPRLTRDARRGYYENVEISGSDGSSFQIIDLDDPAWVRDHRHAWHVSSGRSPDGGGVEHRIRRLEHADAAALRPLGRQYASDGRRVWHQGRPLADADGVTFSVVSPPAAAPGSALPAATPPPDARDARGPFLDGVRLTRRTP
jgi:hypothetical protein